ncbi:urease accessory protein UreF [Bradyrhizobium sp. WD16]|nr:urease accessory protein UreF [Bradyrhizobium sp. WD16]
MTTTIMTIMAMMTTTVMTGPAATIMVMADRPVLPPAGADPAPALAALDSPGLFRLMTWLSPAFPVGAFSYSSGLEWAVEAGDVTSAGSLRDWLAAMLSDGAGFCDAVFMAQAHRRAAAADDVGLGEVAELASAMVPSRERLLETTAQGRAFVAIAQAAWGCERFGALALVLGPSPAYPVAVGALCAAHGIALAPSLQAFLHALTSNWISAAARLVPLGQTDAQRTLAALEADIAATAARAVGAGLDDLGSATFRADLASLRHETQYTRLFRS